jgi:hypothetical protein
MEKTSRDVWNAAIDAMAKKLIGYYDDCERYLGYSIAFNIKRVAEELKEVKRDVVPDTEAAPE